jgi:hypothetical protein
VIAWVEPLTVTTVQLPKSCPRKIPTLFTKLHGAVAYLTDARPNHVLQVFSNALAGGAEDTVLGFLIVTVTLMVLGVQLLC